MTSVAGYLLALTAPIMIGLPVTLAAGGAETWPDRLGLAWLAGSVVTVLGLLVLGLAGIRYHGSWLLALLGVWVAASAWFGRARLRAAFQTHLPTPRLGWAAWFLIGLTGVNLVTAAALAFFTPIAWVWDVKAFWVPKADALASSGSLFALGTTVYPDYPPLWPLQLFPFRAFANGHYATHFLKLLPMAYLMSALAVVFVYLKRRSGPLAAAATVWVISGIPYLWFPYGVNDLMAEVPSMAFVVASTVLLALYLETGTRSLAAACVLLLVGLSLTRPEGFEHAVVVVSVLAFAALRRRDWWSGLASLGAVVLTNVGWLAIVRLGFRVGPLYPIDPARLAQLATPGSVVTILNYGIHGIANPFVFGPTAIAVTAIVLGWRDWRLTWPFVTVFVLDMMSLVATYTVLPATNPLPLSGWLAVGGGFKRMLLHFVPLLYIAGALAISRPLRVAWTTIRQRREGPMAAMTGAVGARHSSGWAHAPVLLFLVGAIAASYGLEGPNEVDLSQVIPNHVSGLAQPPTYLDSAIAMLPSGSAPGSVDFTLFNLGMRLPPNDSLPGRYTGLRSVVRAAPGTRVRFSIRADTQVLASAEVDGGDGGVPIAASIPPYARRIELSVQSVSDADPALPAIWTKPTLEAGGIWWVIAVLLGLAACAGAVVLAAGLGVWSRLPEWRQVLFELGPGAAATAIGAAVVVQQLDALTALALPIWLGAGARCC